MKLPALFVATCFMLGIAWLGGLPATPGQWLAFAVVSLLAGFGLLLRRMNSFALILALLTWTFLGALAASLERAALPADNAAQLVSSGALDTSEPLRWRGRLRGDPLRLPWGYRYEIDLDEVEAAGRARAVSGGLRVSYYFNEQRPELVPVLRAGDHVEALVRARPPRNFLNPGAFDARAHLARQDIHLTGSLRSTELLQRISGPPPSLADRAARIRGRLLDEVNEMFVASPRRAAILRAMLLGDASFVDDELAETFQKTAVYHVLVISGLHVAVLAAFVVWCGRRLRLRMWQIGLVTLLVLLAFLAIVDDKPPILRATLMATVVLFAALWFRRVELLNTVAVAALLILLWRPSALGDPSFQLSFLAAAMIGALGLPWLERSSAPYRRALAHLGDVTRDAAHPPRATQLRLDLRALSSWLAARLPARMAAQSPGIVAAPVSIAMRMWEVTVISTAIQIGMLPLMALYFRRVSLAGPLANIPGAVFSALLIPVGYITLAIGLISSGVGRVLATVLDWLVAALVGSVEWFARWSWGSYRIPDPPTWLLVAFFVALALLALAAHRARRGTWHFITVGASAALGVLVATHPFAPRLEAQRLEVTVLDVGQGDSIFAAFPDGRTLLVDGGGMFGAGRIGGVRTGLDIGEQVVSPYLWQRGIKRLDVVALTHAHGDHLNGLFAVLDNFSVGELWVGRDVDDRAFEGLLVKARARGTRVVHHRRGDHFEWDGVTGLVLWPENAEKAPYASNNDSLVLQLGYGKVSFLLPGDIERPVEDELIARGDPLDVDFLKVPHHGSRTSSTAELLSAATPQAVAISVGEANPFGHPHREVLERLRTSGTRVQRTDQDGAVTVSTDGRALRVTSYAGTFH